MKNYFTLLLLLGLFFACEKSYIYNYDSIIQPENELIDIDDDGISDFSLIYERYEKLDIPVSESRITGSIKPLNDNMLLKHSEKGSLFLRVNDSITKEDSSPILWNDSSANLNIINWDGGKWGKDWIVISELTNDYFLGFQLIYEDIDKIGWMCLNFNSANGEITILNITTTDNDLLIINK